MSDPFDYDDSSRAPFEWGALFFLALVFALAVFL